MDSGDGDADTRVLCRRMITFESRDRPASRQAETHLRFPCVPPVQRELRAMKFEDDLAAARAYLIGYEELDRKGIPRKRFMTEKSKSAVDCKSALARVLRSEVELPSEFRDLLADLFDPTSRSGSGFPWENRKLVAGHREAKRPKDHHANTHMSWFVYQRVRDGKGVEESIQEAMDAFGVSRERMYALWANHRALYEKIWGPLKA